MSGIRILLLLAGIALGGCASSTSKTFNRQDPFEPFNRGVYQFNETLDRAVLKPVAKGYNTVMPTPAKAMVGNFFSNLDDVIITANDLLQFKFVQAFSDTGRILINTSVGVFGLVDVASAVGYDKHNEDFGQTLGYWGVEAGPYLEIPFLGPSSVRDGIGLYVDSRPSRIRLIHRMRTRNQLYALKAINRRAALLETESVMEEAVIDRYEFIRDAYLLRRQSLVYDGHPPHEDLDEDEEEEDKAAPDKSSAAEPAETGTKVAEGEKPQVMAEQPGVHKVWVAQDSGTR